MTNIIKVDINDEFRTLLTDVLPYELPLWFSNYNMYLQFKNPSKLRAYTIISGLNFESHSGTYIPLNYEISRGGNNSPRTISIMHPGAQLKVCNFYQKYNDLIEYYCTKSEFSLRHPYRISTKFYGKTQQGSNFVHGVENFDEERIVSSSYFKYKKYPFLYRFFESYEYHRLEKQFHSMLQVDISKCFPSIYTHSIGWAIKNKRLAKEKPQGSFDASFDNLMQVTNYKETNGIIIGPEVSRIFAEIILQKIDLNIVENMKKYDYNISKDYNFRRYVDDYFVFYRSGDVKNAFIKVLEKCLIEYKMYLNEAKTTISSRPFATNISLAKHSLKNTVNDYSSSRYKNGGVSSEHISQLKYPDSKANKIISSIKMALAQYNVEYISISNYLLSAITKRMLSYLRNISQSEPIEEHHLNWLLVDLDVLFFIHAMDIRIRPTDKLGRSINDVLEAIIDWPKNYQDIIHKKIFDHVKQAINIFINHANEITGLETLNLLIILTMLPNDYQLKTKKIEDYFGAISMTSNTSDFYFRWITFMLYINKKKGYSSLRRRLENEAKNFLLKHLDMFRDTEYFLFYFDYLACPYIDENIRKDIMLEVKNSTVDSKSKKLITVNIDNYSKQLLSEDFIVSWRNPSYLKNSLEKREYLFPYN